MGFSNWEINIVNEIMWSYIFLNDVFAKKIKGHVIIMQEYTL